MGEAGWGYTLIVAIVSFIYFIPVLMIIFMAISMGGYLILRKRAERWQR